MVIAARLAHNDMSPRSTSRAPPSPLSAAGVLRVGPVDCREMAIATGFFERKCVVVIVTIRALGSRKPTRIRMADVLDPHDLIVGAGYALDRHLGDVRNHYFEYAIGGVEGDQGAFGRQVTHDHTSQ